MISEMKGELEVSAKTIQRWRNERRGGEKWQFPEEIRAAREKMYLAYDLHVREVGLRKASQEFEKTIPVVLALARNAVKESYEFSSQAPNHSPFGRYRPAPQKQNHYIRSKSARPSRGPSVATSARPQAGTGAGRQNAGKVSLCQIASNSDPPFACKDDPASMRECFAADGAKTGGAEPHIAEQSRSWRAASGDREVMRGS